MEDETEIYLDSSGSGDSYIESLIRSRQYLKKSQILTKLDELILAEIDLGLMGAAKAKSEILKQTKDNVKPIK